MGPWGTTVKSGQMTVMTPRISCRVVTKKIIVKIIGQTERRK